MPERRTLFVTEDAPRLGSGRALRVHGVVRALAQLGPVDVLYPQRGVLKPGEEYRAMTGVTLHAAAPSRGARRALAYAATRARGVPDGFARGVSPELVRAARRLAATPDRAHVVADGPVCAAALHGLGARVTYNAHNLESQLRADIGDMGSPALLRRFERRLLARVGESWMVSEADMAGARELCPGATLRLVPNVVDAEAISPAPPPAGGPGRVLLLADWTYPPNVEAGRFLLQEIAPLLRAARPGTVLVLAGRDAAGALGLDAAAPPPGVELPGFVPDIGALYATSTCVAVPLLTGGGSPLKFVEALAHGRTVVATPRGAAGLRGTPGVHYRVADGAAAFAAAVGEVLAAGGDPAMATAARELALAEYSITSVVERLRPWATSS